MTKDDLRKILREQRAVQDPKDVRRLSGTMVEAVAAELATCEVSHVFSFLQVGNEPDFALLPQVLPSMLYAYPVVDVTLPGEMEFYLWKAGDRLVSNRFGIMQPDPKVAPKVAADRNTVILVPALAVTRNGDRLGFGGGYYDRYCAKNPFVHRMAAVFDSFVLHTLPTEEHDIRMQSVCTESGVFTCLQ